MALCAILDWRTAARLGAALIAAASIGASPAPAAPIGLSALPIGLALAPKTAPRPPAAPGREAASAPPLAAPAPREAADLAPDASADPAIGQNTGQGAGESADRLARLPPPRPAGGAPARAAAPGAAPLVPEPGGTPAVGAPKPRPAWIAARASNAAGAAETEPDPERAPGIDDADEAAEDEALAALPIPTRKRDGTTALPRSPRGPLPAATPRAGPAPISVQRAATETGLAQNRAALIGVVDLETGRRALLRLPNGTIERVAVGDVLDGWRVSLIAPDALRLTKGAEAHTLLLVGR